MSRMDGAALTAASKIRFEDSRLNGGEIWAPTYALFPW